MDQPGGTYLYLDGVQEQSEVQEGPPRFSRWRAEREPSPTFWQVVQSSSDVDWHLLFPG